MGDRESEVKSWLKSALIEKDLDNFSVRIIGSSEKGEGYIGDVIFVIANGTTKTGLEKNYHLVVKCSKMSKALFEKTPALLKTFSREIYMYKTVFPLFKQFEIDRNIGTPFNSIPKCYGVYSKDSRYFIALENLKKAGYDLWINRTPLTRKHIDLVVSEYAKFHAISVAMREQEPEKFKKIVDGMEGDIFKEIFKTSDFVSIYEDVVEEIFNLLKNHLKESILKKWLTFKEQVRFISLEMAPTVDDLQVIVHGDCWNNNFMYKYRGEEESALSKVAILDWQMANISSPIIDLSYFLFACISEQDISSIDVILKSYYDAFSDHLAELGSEFASKYPFEKLLEEWKKYSKFGVMVCLLPVKLCYLDVEDKPDITKGSDSGDDASKSFAIGVKDKDNTDFVNRIKPIVKYAVENELI